MTKCRYSRDRGEYLNDGEPCRVDDYGDPTRHCTARRTCANHVGEGELTCARCIGRVRANLARIVDLTHLMPTLALASGIDSEAVNLAGPACDPKSWSEHQIARRGHLAAWYTLGRITERQHTHARLAMEDDDERHPLNLLGRWDMMIREDYDHPSDDPVTVENAAAYLDRQLGRIAQDPNQDFGLFANEIRRCRNHLEGVLRNSHAPERGAPCPECTSEETGVGPRLVREYGHWCEDEDCAQQFHYVDDAGDRWVCPKDHDHWWTHEDYSRWVEERHAASVR